MPAIFDYLNYRDFLLDFYNEQKSRNPHFSYQTFSDKAGFKSKSFIKLVIDEKKSLSADSTAKLNRVLKLGDKAFSYFKDLVAFNQARNAEVRTMYFEKLCGYNKRNSARLMLQNTWEFYSRWYYNTIRELAAFFDFGDDFEALGKQVQPPISARQARQAVRVLLRLGLLERTENGYRQTDRIITTGDEVQSLAVHNFHLQNMAVAAGSLDSCPAPQRDISCLVVGLSEETFREFKGEIQRFRKKLLDISAREQAPDRVYHVNFHLFPTSKIPPHGGPSS